MNKERFLELCDTSYSHIPVYEEFVADLISPLYIFSNFVELFVTIIIKHCNIPGKGFKKTYQGK